MKLLPCPFCGSSDLDGPRHDGPDIYSDCSVWCDCGAELCLTVPAGDDAIAKVAAAWNRRVSQ